MINKIIFDKELELIEFPAKDAFNVKYNAEKIADFLCNSTKKPYIYGILGGWGSGKTTFIGYLSEILRNRNISPDNIDKPINHIMYFNAYKYSNEMDLLPALSKKIISELYNKEPSFDFSKLMCLLSSMVLEHKDKLSIGLKYTLNALTSFFSKAKEKFFISSKGELLNKYRSDTEIFQETFLNIISNSINNDKLFIIIDELDRCEPHEAYEFIKQLRIFFSIKHIPVIFILSINTEPIGFALKKIYDYSNFEPKMVIEKFFDSYVNLPSQESLEKFIVNLQSKHFLNNELLNSYVIQKCNANDKHLVLKSIYKSNYYYNNLRLLEKCLDNIFRSSDNKNNYFLWTKWHLEILNSLNKNLRLQLSDISHELTFISIRTHLTFFSNSVNLTNYNNIPYTNYEKYFSMFEKSLRYSIQNCASSLKTEIHNIEFQNLKDILDNILKESNLSLFISNLLMIPIHENELKEIFNFVGS